MLDDNATSHDEALSSLIVAYDAGLIAEQTPTLVAVPNELRERFDRAKTCLHRLERDRRVRNAASWVCTDFQVRDVDFDSGGGGQIGRFRLQRVLGSGGFGIVYLAEDTLLNRLVALKVPRPEVLIAPELRQRFLREAQATARLSHPNIVPVYDSGEEGPFCYLVTAYCEGGTLAAWLDRKEKPVTPRQAAELITLLAGAVQHAHERGIIHRDLKPANILLQIADVAVQGDATGPSAIRSLQSAIPRVTDFGLAKVWEPDLEARPAVLDAQGTLPQRPTAALTQALTVLGTPAYMAPEQAEPGHGTIGPATDLYSLGAILYELLTGKPPFQGGGPLEVLRRVVHEEPVRPSRLRPGLPRDLEAICLKCLEKQPERRYARAAELADDLRRFLDGQVTRARPNGPGKRALKWCHRHRTLTGLIAVAAVGLLALGLESAWHRRQLRAYDEAFIVSAGEERSLGAVEERGRFMREQHYARGLRLAGELWASGQKQPAIDALSAHFPAPGTQDLRDFGWYFQWRRVSGLRQLVGHSGWVTSVAFSPDGRTCASASTDGIRLWETGSGRVLRRLQSGEATTPLWLRFSPDGRQLVSGAWGEDGVVKVWSLATGQPVAQLTGPKSEFYQIAISPDCQSIATGGRGSAPDGTGLVKIWEPNSGSERVVWQLPKRGSNVTALGFAEGTRCLAVAYHEETGLALIDLVDLQTGKVQATLSGHQHFIFKVDFSPDGRTLASGCCDETVKLWDCASGREKHTLRLEHCVRAIAFSPDGKTLATGWSAYRDVKLARGASVSLWDVGSGKRLAQELPTEHGIASLAYAADGRTLAVGCTDNVLRLWDPGPRTEFVDLPGHAPREAWSVAFAPDGRTLASAGDDHAVRLWDVGAGRLRAVGEGHEQLVTCIAYSPDGLLIASSSFDRTVRLWDAASGKLLETLRGHVGHARGLAFAPDGKTLASCSRDKTVRLWDVASRTLQATLTESPHHVQAVAYSPDGQRLAAVGNFTSVLLWDVATRQHRVAEAADSTLFSVAFSRDGRQIAAGGTGLVFLWNAETGQRLPALTGHAVKAPIFGLAFSPDGKTLATAGEDRSVRLWQAATGQQLLAFTELPTRANAVAFSPDGKTLAAALHDGSLRLWSASSATD